MLKNYFKIAWRNILNQKLHSLINIGGLSVAMAAAVLIIMWVQNELLFDSYHPGADRIYLVKTYEYADKNNVFISENSPYGLSTAMTQEFPEVEMVTQAQRTQKNELTLNIKGELFTEEWGMYVDKNWFDVFHYEFLEGSPKAFFFESSQFDINRIKSEKTFW